MRFALNGVRISLTQGGFPQAGAAALERGRRREEESSAGKIIMGREIKASHADERAEPPRPGNVVVEGKRSSKCEFREAAPAGMWLALIRMTDYEGLGHRAQRMLEKDVAPLRPRFDRHVAARRGRMELPYDGQDMQLNPRDIIQIEHEPRMDTAEEKRVELHLHTRMSNMDALTDTAAAVKRADQVGDARHRHYRPRCGTELPGRLAYRRG